MEVFLLWLAFAIVVGIAASARGRSGLAWFLIAVLISPLIALIAVLVMRNLAQTSWAQEPHSTAPATKKCPQCAEQVMAEATICRFCRHEFGQQPQQPASRVRERQMAEAARAHPLTGRAENGASHPVGW